MKIVHIIPGFGGTFYCGNCLRDSAVARSLLEAGHQATVLPVYLPLVQNGSIIPDGPPVFYGAVSIFLKQKFPLFRSLPGWADILLNSKPVLNYAVKKAGSTRAKGMEELTISMLQGEEGLQKDELDELVNYLRDHEKPDVVHLSNALLLGMAKRIRKEVNVPVVCTLQDEDVWIDAMSKDYQERLWTLVGKQAAVADALISVSDWFAGIMKNKMKISGRNIHVVPIGIDASRYTISSSGTGSQMMGYLSRICEENGFGILVDAFIKLKKNPETSGLRLRASGGYTDDDKSFLREQIKKLKENHVDGSFELIRNYNDNDPSAFFNGLTLLSVPVLKGEAFGLYQLEAMASGVPVVQPELGAFPEVISRSGGGVVYQPNNADTLAETISGLLKDPQRISELSRSARAGVELNFDSKKTINQLVSVYQNVISNFKPSD